MYQPRKDSAHTLGLGVGHGLKISCFHSLIFSRSEKQRATQNQWIVKRKNIIRQNIRVAKENKAKWGELELNQLNLVHRTSENLLLVHPSIRC